MNMKKVLASVAAGAMAVSAMAVASFAAQIWTGSADQGIKWAWNPATVEASAFADAAEGDVVSISFTVNGEDETKHQLKIASGSDAAALLTSPEGVDAQWGTIDVEESPLSFALNAADLATVKANGLLIYGYDVTITGVELGTAASGATDNEATADEATDTATEAGFNATMGAQFDSSFNATIGEWTDDAVASGSYDKATTITYDFGSEKVKLAGNYLGIKTNVPFDVAEGAVNNEVVVSSIMADDREIEFDASKVYVGDNDSEAGTIKITLFNEWDTNVQGNPAVDYNAINGDAGFSKLSVTFTVKALANEPAATEAPATEAPATEAPATEAPATEAPATEAPATEAPASTEAVDTTAAPAAGDTTATTTDKTSADTGVEGVAVAAGLAIIAAGAVVIAKKRG